MSTEKFLALYFEEFKKNLRGDYKVYLISFFSS